MFKLDLIFNIKFFNMKLFFNIKLFFNTTAFFEGFTGLALIAVPKFLVQILFLSNIAALELIVIARIAGAALITIALLCWFAKDSFALLLRLLLFYNMAVAIIAIYSVTYLGLKSFGITAIIGYHMLFAVWGLVLLKKLQIN